jgi:DNA-binding NarL/FixJ family response regulator
MERTLRIVRDGNETLHKSVVSFTARQTFARLAEVDEKRELMGAHTALSRKIQPRYEKIDAELLTPRQCEILRLVSIGHTNREIADVLEISVRTVEVHRFNLMRRLNVRNVAQLLRRALQLGLLAKTFGAK